MADKKDLAIAYGVRKRMGKGAAGASCPNCMAAGGKCMAHGGMAPEPSGETSGSPTLDAAVRGKNVGSTADAVLEKRRAARMAAGGMVEDDETETDEMDAAPDFDFEPAEMEENGAESADDAQDMSLVGRILKKRRAGK